MKAIVCEDYGLPEVLTLKEVATPRPKEDEVMVRIRATTVSSADGRVRSASFPAGFRLAARLALGVLRPRNPILGQEFAGEVVAIGEKVTCFDVGDAVFGICAFGAYAEYRCIPERGAIAPKPTNLSYEQAAAIPFGAHTAIYFLRDRARVQAGEKVLIYGASGAVGTASIQLAKRLGAEVTAVCSAGNRELVNALGADHVVDYATEDFTRNGESYDIIMDAVGKTSFARCRRSLSEKGRFLIVSGDRVQFLHALVSPLLGDKRVIAGVASGRSDDLLFMKEIIEEGDYRAVIDRRYRLAEAVDAHRYVDQGHKKGNVVLTI